VTTVVQLSDPHFGTERPEVVEAAVALVQSLRPELIVLSGDITQRARRAQFARAAAFVARLEAPALLAVPGNHDIPLFDLLARGFAPYANYSRVFGEDLEPSFESAELLVLCVNTTRWRRHKHGEVSALQVERVARRLEQASHGQLRMVVTHQPVHVTRAADENNLLRGAEQAVRRWSAAGADLVAGGHIHLPYVRPLSERFSNLSRRAWAVQAGTAVSHRTRDGIPNSLNVISTATGAKCSIERWDYDAARSSFGRVETHVIELDRSERPRPATR
jgi:3',5'-cyclic AMP phosphodiesterase CpdA